MTYAQACLKKLWENVFAIFGPVAVVLLAQVASGKMPTQTEIIGLVAGALSGAIALALKQGSSAVSVKTPAIMPPPTP
jgi:hypothetical protein